MSDASPDDSDQDEAKSNTNASRSLAAGKLDVEEESSALDILQFSGEENAPGQAHAAGGTVSYRNDDIGRGLETHFEESSSGYPVDNSSSLSAPVPYNLSVTTPFQQWIDDRHLSKYSAAFDSSGYADLELLAFLTQSETERMISSAFAHCRCV